MESFFQIADQTIKITSADVDYTISEAYKPFLINCNQSLNPEFCVEIKRGLPESFNKAELIFEAINSNNYTGPQNSFWKLFKANKSIFAAAFTGSDSNIPDRVLEINSTKNWKIYCSKADYCPFEHPIGSMLIFYIALHSSAVFIHASGVWDGKKGRIFTGRSGIGKTTISKIWQQSGAELIHDDRLILKKIGNKVYGYNSPGYADDKPKKFQIDEIFLLSQEKQNQIQEVTGINKTSLVFSNIIQQNGDKQLLEPILQNTAEICNELKVFKLGFKPDISVVDFVKTCHL